MHSLDAVRWLLGKKEHPRTAYCIGGLYEAGEPTDQATPNTQYATYQYADGTELHCDLRNWFSGPREAQGMYVYGSKGWMKVGDDKAEVFFGRRSEPGPTLTADGPLEEGPVHFQNFIDCVRSRQVENLRAPLEEAGTSGSRTGGCCGDWRPQAPSPPFAMRPMSPSSEPVSASTMAASRGLR